MKACTLVFPHQLYEENPALEKGRTVFVVEEFLFFRQYRFHKQKLKFHRASMKFYEDFLRRRGYDVTYIDAADERADIRNLLPRLILDGFSEFHFCEVADDWLGRRLRDGGAKLVEYDSPMFLNTTAEVDSYFADRKRYFQTDFYVRERKRRRILIEDVDRPVGGKWTFDAENRLRYPKEKIPPTAVFPPENSFHREASEYVERHFGANYGEIGGGVIYPVTHAESRTWLDDFLRSRFAEFGAFEDAIVAREHFINHSLISPLLNSGLLTPREVVGRALEFAENNPTPLNSLEGFIRQIIGWREFIRGVYRVAGRRQRTLNFWGFRRKLQESFWRGETGIEPVDLTIRKVLRTGYCHHIERLMVIGNFMLLCEFDPDDVYRWFMELFIDAYDWVMVPNVYGMVQFADGGLMTTKPYISGSNYLMKMSDFEKGEWQAVWDGLFWRFMDTHREFFQRNPRLGMLVRTFDKMNAEKRSKHIAIAENFLGEL